MDFSSYSDEDLLALIREDNRRAFDAFFKKHWRRAHGIIFSKLKSAEVTEEIVQDIFMMFWEKRHTLSITNFVHYLNAVIKYRVINHLEKEATSERYKAYYVKFNHIAENETEQAVAYNELLTLLENGVQHLPEKSQKAFRLNFLEGRSVGEIAKLLNLSEKAIQYHLTRSVRELKLHLKNFTLSVAILTWLGH
jgi:RNA polymerase sigma factor (sigma-70 family)